MQLSCHTVNLGFITNLAASYKYISFSNNSFVVAFVAERKSSAGGQ